MRLFAFFPENTTVVDALEKAEVNYSTAMTILNGAKVDAGSMTKTFADLGYDGTPGKDRVTLIAVTKRDNA